MKSEGRYNHNYCSDTVYYVQLFKHNASDTESASIISVRYRYALNPVLEVLIDKRIILISFLLAGGSTVCTALSLWVIQRPAGRLPQHATSSLPVLRA
jgi:hypothetical protein